VSAASDTSAVPGASSEARMYLVTGGADFIGATFVAALPTAGG
jgi:hypothetical protein